MACAGVVGIGWAGYPRCGALQASPALSELGFLSVLLVNCGGCAFDCNVLQDLLPVPMCSPVVLQTAAVCRWCCIGDDCTLLSGDLVYVSVPGDVEDGMAVVFHATLHFSKPPV